MHSLIRRIHITLCYYQEYPKVSQTWRSWIVGSWSWSLAALSRNGLLGDKSSLSSQRLISGTPLKTKTTLRLEFKPVWGKRSLWSSQPLCHSKKTNEVFFDFPFILRKWRKLSVPTHVLTYCSFIFRYWLLQAQDVIAHVVTDFLGVQRTTNDCLHC